LYRRPPQVISVGGEIRDVTTDGRH
jgi:hypothetical protein